MSASRSKPSDGPQKPQAGKTAGRCVGGHPEGWTSDFLNRVKEEKRLRKEIEFEKKLLAQKAGRRSKERLGKLKQALKDVCRASPETEATDLDSDEEEEGQGEGEVFDGVARPGTSRDSGGSSTSTESMSPDQAPGSCQWGRCLALAGFESFRH